jgi:hypothetical protein
MDNDRCLQCGETTDNWNPCRKFCSKLCKNRHFKRHGRQTEKGKHVCRFCGKIFDIGNGQNNKWLCSDACRRGMNAKSVREFATRRPERNAMYRLRHRGKCGPDSNIKRFYRWNPNAPRQCEACGEKRVLEIAHKPGHWRSGERRASHNMRWPEQVWVLCPTCHRLIDRMRYPPEELGLSS